MGEGPAPIPAGGSCWTASSPFQEPRVDLSTWGHLHLAYEESAHQNPSPTQGLEVVHQWKPTPGFVDVTTCLRSQLSEEVPKMPPIPVVMGMMAAPGMATMSASRVVWDEATGATYLDTVTTSIGRVAFSVPEDEIIMPGPKIEDFTDLL